VVTYHWLHLQKGWWNQYLGSKGGDHYEKLTDKVEYLSDELQVAVKKTLVNNLTMSALYYMSLEMAKIYVV